MNTKATTTLLLAFLPASMAFAQQVRPPAPDPALGGGTYLDAANANVAPIPAEVVMFRLRSGAIQWGAIEEHAPEEITIRRLDTGGVVRLPWALLDPIQELDLRQRFGYVDTDSEEIMLDGHKLVLHDGSEMFGMIINYTDEHYVLKQNGGSRMIMKRLVKQVAETQVAALDMHTKDELYLRESGLVDAAGKSEDPQAHYELAEYCERIFDFAHALEHYEQAQELSPDFMPGELPNIIARVNLKSGQQEQLDALATIDRQNRKRLYSPALEGLALFDAAYPDSPLRVDRLKLEEKIESSREAYVKDKIVRLKWYSWMERLAAKAAREQSFEGALAFVDETMSEEIVRRVTEDAKRVWPDIEPDQVRQLWVERKPGRWRHASYGLGTWLLGEDDALKGGPEAAKEDEEPGSARDAKREDLDKKIERFLKNQQRAKRAKRSESDVDEIEVFWSGMTHGSRRGWLLAYYAENAGDLEVNPTPHLGACPTCGGKGYREVVYTGSARTGSGSGGLRKEICETCKGIGVTRRIHFR